MEPDFLKNAKYPFQVKYDVDWPSFLIYKGFEYCREYDRAATRISDGCPCYRYFNMENDYDYVWLYLDGDIKED